MKLKKASITTQCAWRARVARRELRMLKTVTLSLFLPLLPLTPSTNFLYLICVSDIFLQILCSLWNLSDKYFFSYIFQLLWCWNILNLCIYYHLNVTIHFKAFELRILFCSLLADLDAGNESIKNFGGLRWYLRIWLPRWSDCFRLKEMLQNYYIFIKFVCILTQTTRYFCSYNECL